MSKQNPQEVHIMVDIETLGNTSNAHIVEISASVMDNQGDIPPFKVNIDPWRTQKGAEISGDTVKWWQEQSYDLRQDVMSGRHTLAHALVQLNTWLNAVNPTYVWANSPAFDCVILENAFNREQITSQLPAFWAWLDVRTMHWLNSKYGLDIGKPKNTHNSAVDVANQIVYVKALLNSLTRKI